MLGNQLMTAHAIVSSARKLLSTMRPSMASAATKKMYEAEAERLLTKAGELSPEKLWLAICDTHSKRTYHRRIASMMWVLQNDLAEFLTDDAAAFDQSSIMALNFILQMHSKIELHRNQCALAEVKPRRSKRQALRGLPGDWREAILSRLIAIRSDYLAPFLVAAVTGCRPEELHRGVDICIDDQTITFRIAGAKLKSSQGQPVREIIYPIDAHSVLLQAIKRYALGLGLTRITIDSPGSFQKAMSRASKLLWPRKKENVTPYCLRHQAASDWKACSHLSSDDISGALGHFASDTKRLYGQAQMSKSGGLQPIAVHAERPIKQTSRPHPKFHGSKRLSL